MILAHLIAAGVAIHNPADATAAATVLVNGREIYLLAPGAGDVIAADRLPATLVFVWQDDSREPAAFSFGGTCDVDGDGDAGTDLDIEAFFRCVGPGSDGPDCEVSDWDGDGANGTDQDICAFFRTLAGG